MDQLEQILQHGSKLFNRGGVLSLWQTIADNFYPERADFTTIHNEGDEFGEDLSSSYPVLARRELGDSLSSMLRPTSKNWFHMRTKENWDKVGVEARAWLEHAETIQRRAMYHRQSGFVNSTKQGDHDFSAFGQAVIQLSLNRDGNGLLYRTWHLRDVAWAVNENLQIDTIYRKWMPTVRDVCKLFGDKVHGSIKEKLEKNPLDELEVWHIIVPCEMYLTKKKINPRNKFMSLYVDVKNKTVLEEVAIPQHGYIIPRWRTISGSAYAVSPATVVALPDARLLQAMIGTLLEAGEKAVNPPMLADKQIFRGDFSIYPGGITWADMDGGRINDHYMQLPIDKNGIPLGRDMAQDVRQTIIEAFYLNKLTLPPPGVDRTAYEVGQRVQEYIRQAMPLFEPMESEYNGPVCENTFDTLMRVGAFGSPFDMPKELHGLEFDFVFESPLHDAVERAKGQNFLEAKSMIAEAAGIDPTSAYVFDVKKAIREVLSSIGTPAAWMRTEADAQAKADEAEQMQRNAELLAQMQQGADVAKTIGETTTQPGGVVNR